MYKLFLVQGQQDVKNFYILNAIKYKNILHD